MSDVLRKPSKPAEALPVNTAVTTAVTTDCHSLDHVQLVRFLERRRANPTFPLELRLAENLVEVLRRANGFVPSDAGSILLDNPAEKQDDRRKNLLTFIAAFGEKSEVAGRADHPGRPGDRRPRLPDRRGLRHLRRADDRFFYRGVDEQTSYQTESLIAVPIRIEQEVCGVLELINRRNAAAYSREDRQPPGDLRRLHLDLDPERPRRPAGAGDRQARQPDRPLQRPLPPHRPVGHHRAAARREDIDLAVLFLDLDFFKRVNDTHGHLAGSQVLREVGHLLRGTVSQQARHRRRATAATSSSSCFRAATSSDAIDLAEEIRAKVIGTTFCAVAGRDPARSRST